MIIFSLLSWLKLPSYCWEFCWTYEAARIPLSQLRQTQSFMLGSLLTDVCSVPYKWWLFNFFMCTHRFEKGYKIIDLKLYVVPSFSLTCVFFRCDGVAPSSSPLLIHCCSHWHSCSHPCLQWSPRPQGLRTRHVSVRFSMPCKKTSAHTWSTRLFFSSQQQCSIGLHTPTNMPTLHTPSFHPCFYTYQNWKRHASVHYSSANNPWWGWKEKGCAIASIVIWKARLLIGILLPD